MTTPDLIQRLRAYVESDHYVHAESLCAEAADELERLRESLAEECALRVKDGDELERLRAQVRAQQVVIDGMDRRNVHQGREVGALMQKAADVQGERDANAILTDEVERLTAENERLRAQVAPAGLERCEFDDECDFCATPEGGSFTRLIHNPEDVTEAEFYICGSCVHKALSRYIASPAAPAQQALTDLECPPDPATVDRAFAAPSLTVGDTADFTDWGRAAVAWVLWHHQGGSSAIGQPLRFALGLSAHEPLPAHLVASAQEWAKSVGATTDEFHQQKGQPAAQAEPVSAKHAALMLCYELEKQPASSHQTAAVLAAFKVYRAFESIEKHGEIRQWVFDVAAPCAA